MHQVSVIFWARYYYQHWQAIRAAHITAIRNDGVNPGLLGMTKVVSEDSLRRNLAKVE